MELALLQGPRKLPRGNGRRCGPRLALDGGLRTPLPAAAAAQGLDACVAGAGVPLGQAVA